MYQAEWSGLKKLLMLKAASGGSAPQTETLSGSLVTFETTKARPLQQCRVDFLPVQSGSGDPSPENVRPISGWDGLSVHVSPTTTGGTEYPVSWQSEAGTVYGGYVDLVRGVLVATYAVAILKKSDFGAKQTGTAISYRQSDGIFPICDSGISWTKARTQQLFNYGKIANPYSESSYGNYVGIVIFQRTLSATNSYVRISEDVYEAMGDNDEAVISFVLATPITYTLTPQQITALIGTNNIWSDAGNVTVTYTK